MTPETVRVITFSMPLAAVAAESEGYFAEESLDVAFAITAGSGEQMRGVLEGRWDIAHTAADNVMAYNDRDGSDFIVFLVADLGLHRSFS